MNSHLSSRRSAAGYALLEALVAVIVTSIGFIGAARLQTLGLSFNNSAVFRQKATQLGYQMTDRMRANQVGMAVGAYNNPVADPTLTCLTDATVCTPGQLAQADAAVWLADVAAQLPSGSGVVCIDGTPDDGADAANPDCDGVGQVLAVKVWWTDTLGESRFVTVARP
ncbi:MAG: type IV pilus modification protein PilV [Burkholderiaceae bacterium]|nr:type IV pilus modification protein PilV [Burkholderiaceae bacterium]MDH3461098.1 type IV pilus modification protein PilV [Burkholderiaceae bacterium]